MHGPSEIHIQQGFWRGELMQTAILIQPVETALLDVAERVPQNLWRRLRGLLLAAARARGLRLCHAQFVKHVKPAPWRERQNFVRDCFWIVAAYLGATLDAKRLPAAGKQEPQIIVNFSSGCDRRPRVAR